MNARIIIARALAAGLIDDDDAEQLTPDDTRIGVAADVAPARRRVWASRVERRALAQGQRLSTADVVRAVDAMEPAPAEAPRRRAMMAPALMSAGLNTRGPFGALMGAFMGAVADASMEGEPLTMGNLVDRFADAARQYPAAVERERLMREIESRLKARKKAKK